MLQPNIEYERKFITIRDSFILPRDVVDTYKMGLALNNLVFERLQPFKARLISTALKEILVYLDSFYEKEQNLFSAWLNYELNLQSKHFYDSLGLVIEGDCISDDNLIHLNKLLIRDLNTIENHIALIDDLVERKEKNITTAFIAWLDLRDSISFLYHKLSRLYPDGSIRDALREMADILDKDQDSIILSNKLFAKSL